MLGEYWIFHDEKLVKVIWPNYIEMNVELVLVYVENIWKWIKLLVPVIGAIIENPYDSGFVSLTLSWVLPASTDQPI